MWRTPCKKCGKLVNGAGRKVDYHFECLPPQPKPIAKPAPAVVMPVKPIEPVEPAAVKAAPTTGETITVKIPVMEVKRIRLADSPEKPRRAPKKKKKE